MSDATRRGQADHRAVELAEPMAMILDRRAAAGHSLGSHAGRLLAACVIEDAARRWWERRGYTFPKERKEEVTSAD